MEAALQTPSCRISAAKGSQGSVRDPGPLSVSLRQPSLECRLTRPSSFWHSHHHGHPWVLSRSPIPPNSGGNDHGLEEAAGNGSAVGSGQESSDSSPQAGEDSKGGLAGIGRGLTLFWSSGDLSALVTNGPSSTQSKEQGGGQGEGEVSVLQVPGESGRGPNALSGLVQDSVNGDLEKRAEKLLEAEFARASDPSSSEGEVQVSGFLLDSTEGTLPKPEVSNKKDERDGNKALGTEEAEKPGSPSPGESSSGDTPSSIGAAGGRSASSFRWAQSVMSSLASRVNDLEKGLKNREQDMEEGKRYLSMIKEQLPGKGSATRLRQAEEMARRMQLQLKDMERTVAAKDDAVVRLLKQTALTEKRVVEVERQSALEQEEMRRELQTERARSRTALDSVMRREEGLRQKLQEAQDGIAERDAFLKQLQEEAALSASALKQAAQAMVAARERTLRIEEQLEVLGDQLVKEKDNTSREKQKSAQLSAELTEARMTIEDLSDRVRQLELENADKEMELLRSTDRLAQSGRELGTTAEAVESAERRIAELEVLLALKKEELRQEVQVSADALETAAAKEKALAESEEKAHQLSSEVQALKAELDDKEKSMEAIRNETLKNAALLTSAARTRKELAEAQKKVNQLETQVDAIQAEVAEKESFLQDVRADAKSSAEALRTAALIKQELNEVREREGQLMDELEAKESELQMLKAEMEENVRAQRAEMALQDLSRRAVQVESERDALRSGIAKRDQALMLMKQELERGGQMLSAAADTREALQSMKAQMDAMQQEAMNKGRRLSELEDEIVGVGQPSFPWLQPRQKRTLKVKRAEDGSAPDVNSPRPY